MRTLPVDADGELPDGGVVVDAPLSDPVRFRLGWMVGDGTGCGKPRARLISARPATRNERQQYEQRT